MIDWLNDNSGAVQAFAVCALVVVTAAYAWFTWRMSREMREQRLALDRPALLLDIANMDKIEWRHSKSESREYTYPKTVVCSIHNAGHHVATEVSIEVRHPGAAFQWGGRKGFLLPGETWEASIDAKAPSEVSSGELQGLDGWLRGQGEPAGWFHDEFTDSGVVVYYSDVHGVRWATYVLFMARRFEGEAEPIMMVSEQRRIRLKEKWVTVTSEER
jgi:hypothetical protein